VMPTPLPSLNSRSVNRLNLVTLNLVNLTLMVLKIKCCYLASFGKLQIAVSYQVKLMAGQKALFCEV